MSKQLFHNTAIYAVTALFSQGLMFLFWLMLGGWMTPAQIAVYSLILFVADFFGVINIFGTDVAMTRFYFSEHGVSKSLVNAMAIFAAAALPAPGLFIVLRPLIASVIPDISTVIYSTSGLIIVLIPVYAAANLALVHYTAMRRAGDYAVVNLIKTAVFFGLSAVLVRAGSGIHGLLLALIISCLTVFAIFLVREWRLVSTSSVSAAVIKDELLYGLPLMLYAVIGVAVLYAGRILLGRYSDLASLGVYSFFLALVLQANGIWATFNKAWTPEIFSRYTVDPARALDNARTMAFASVFAYLLFSAIVIIAGQAGLFGLIFKEIYRNNLRIFYILLLGPLFNGAYTALYPLFYYDKKTHVILYLSAGLSILNAAVTLIAVKLWSSVGAALAFTAMSAVSMLAYVVVYSVRKTLPADMLAWCGILVALMAAAVALLLKFDSAILFVAVLCCSAAGAFVAGSLASKRYLFAELLSGYFKKIRGGSS